MKKNKLFNKFKKYRFEFRHVTVLLIALIFFQLLLSIIQKSSLHNFLIETQKWYQQDSAERIANLTTTSLELLLENIISRKPLAENEEKKIIQSFNIILSQQFLQQNVQEICLLFPRNNDVVAIDDGKDLYNFLTNKMEMFQNSNSSHQKAISLYNEKVGWLNANERIFSDLEKKQTFHMLVPFVPHGEFLGVLYMKVTPDFSSITREIISSYDEVSFIYSALILIGLLAMYFISSNTVKERDNAQKLLFEENQKHMKEQIIHEKESQFTKRIYHTHHKAEKVMGFIKEDLRLLSENNIEEVKHRVNKYANFISRVIYDMKWFDPPVNTIRNPMFKTNLNELIRFIIKDIFLRISSKTDMFEFKLDLDESLPTVNINEFVVWELFEPLIQNSIDHAGKSKITISISSRYYLEKNYSEIIISDNGHGIKDDLLKKNEYGIRDIFMENITTKDNDSGNKGYGCFIAYHIAKKRCGFDIDAENIPEGGCRFIIKIPY
ncbi:MAG TPA: HAMP domain-containing sensor histidine kinase [Ignavibacteriaceae bacterium]|nr:HAMP domain-containing sensor histidine kinase [Ignavibacteriaceae bacterium]